MKAHFKKLTRRMEDLRAGREPQVTTQDLLSHEVGEVPIPEERAVLGLATAIHEAESTSVVVSWSAQERACDYFNEHGLSRTLDRIVELGGSLD